MFFIPVQQIFITAIVIKSYQMQATRSILPQQEGSCTAYCVGPGYHDNQIQKGQITHYHWNRRGH